MDKIVILSQHCHVSEKLFLEVMVYFSTGSRGKKRSLSDFTNFKIQKNNIKGNINKSHNLIFTSWSWSRFPDISSQQDFIASLVGFELLMQVHRIETFLVSFIVKLHGKALSVAGHSQTGLCIHKRASPANGQCAFLFVCYPNHSKLVITIRLTWLSFTCMISCKIVALCQQEVSIHLYQHSLLYETEGGCSESEYSSATTGDVTCHCCENWSSEGTLYVMDI